MGNWRVLLSSLLLGLSLPGIGFWPLAWLGMVPALLALSHCQSSWKAWQQGFVWGSLYHAIVFGWFWSLHPLTWMHMAPWASLAITALGWLICFTLQGLIVSVIWVSLYHLIRRFPHWNLPFTLPVLWSLGLWFLNQHPIGLPWGFLAYSQVDIPLIRKSTYSLTFFGLEGLILACNGLIWLWIQRRDVRPLALAMGCLGLSLVCGWRYPSPLSNTLNQTPALAIQGNIPLEIERQEMTPEQREAHYGSLIKTALYQFPTSPHVVILPEGIIALHPEQWTLPRRFPQNIPILSGGTFYDHAESQPAAFNGALLFQPGEMTQRFSKRYLVPFGETTAFLPKLITEEWLPKAGLNLGLSFSPGQGSQPLFFLGNKKIGPLICFEALYPNLAWRYRNQKADMLVTFSNLSWYHQNPLLEKQFLAFNQFRASEAGIPLILATNTGISAFISERGYILTQSHSGKTEALTAETVLNLEE